MLVLRSFANQVAPGETLPTMAQLQERQATAERGRAYHTPYGAKKPKVTPEDPVLDELEPTAEKSWGIAIHGMDDRTYCHYTTQADAKKLFDELVLLQPVELSEVLKAYRLFPF